jgi:3-hydroxyacyl-[acyl-carrier-protein] dehydratase
MSREKIEAAIPHRSPMLMIDEIVQQDEQLIVCRKTFRHEEFFFQGHYPAYPLVPGVILCEAALQAGAILVSGYLEAGRVPVVTRMSDVKFKRIVQPGETIELEVRLNERLADTFYMQAKITGQGKLVARLDFVCTMAEID